MLSLCAAPRTEPPLQSPAGRPHLVKRQPAGKAVAVGSVAVMSDSEEPMSSWPCSVVPQKSGLTPSRSLQHANATHTRNTCDQPHCKGSTHEFVC